MKKSPLSVLLLLGSAIPVMAHPTAFHGLDGSGAAQAGFFHPLTGVDHLVVMVAIGLWAVQMGGRALWALPASFVGSMLLGGLVGLSGYQAPIAEAGILASILLLGTALGIAWNPPLWVAAIFVGAGGLCHGYAHGAEMTAGLAPAVYFGAMIVATTLLHTLGVGTGLALKSKSLYQVTRISGLMILAFGIYDFIRPIS